MSTTSAVNVLRYSALSVGVFYGFYHQRSINATQRAAAARREYEHKQALIDKAKAEYTKSKQPVTAATTKSATKQDPEDPNFDLEAYLTAFAKENP
ncbi:putative mitochondrial f0 subunit e protein [Phaeoacremonium minimum UCRPA7]|uniref:ATP synthase F(0) complex subunit e, mitochondrial n=1 Tax=Phaeoacremonium minimum (strain UCR-PA7) TaxID=1286976 RepID=R8BD90_PHAM7|nr:putative mitochondrial f0 subunit e protein [Phaeoacremonium minimum UCRPA7]EON97257.1 putative mitochondrial f0 subunit e protein [Phaeoacremonium minimum UCRPA7]